jgi:hypothetical protein
MWGGHLGGQKKPIARCRGNTSVQVACYKRSEAGNIGGFPPARNFGDFFMFILADFWGIQFSLAGDLRICMYVRDFQMVKLTRQETSNLYIHKTHGLKHVCKTPTPPPWMFEEAGEYSRVGN